jgi:hypothetical protein
MLLWREIKDNEMGGACSTLGEEKCIQIFGFKDFTEDTAWDIYT